MSRQPEAGEIARCRGRLVETCGVDDVGRKGGHLRREPSH